jgi:hypothetical protein
VVAVPQLSRLAQHRQAECDRILSGEMGELVDGSLNDERVRALDAVRFVAFLTTRRARARE